MNAETGFALREEMCRVRLMLAIQHKDCTSSSMFPIIRMEQLLREGEQALISGDLMEMQRVTKDLKGIE